jgi:hypothetical protein
MHRPDAQEDPRPILPNERVSNAGGSNQPRYCAQRVRSVNCARVQYAASGNQIGDEKQGLALF